jgi:Domain of unknown function (DUF1877)
MGVRCAIYQVGEAEVLRIKADPEAVYAILDENWKRPTNGPRLEKQLRLFDLPPIPRPKTWSVSLGKEWYVLHFLLNQGNSADGPLTKAICGGELVYGDAFKILGRAEVREVAEVLESLTREELRRRFDSPKFRAEVASAYWYDRVEDYWSKDREAVFPFLMRHFNSLVDIYRDARRCGNSLLIEIH